MRSRRRNTDHPEGAPDPWESDQPAWPPRQPEPAEPEGDTLEEKLQSSLSFMDRLPEIRARIRSCLLDLGFPELYAETIAEDAAEGWANGDPAPIYYMPGYEPPQNDPENVRISKNLRDCVDAWVERWGPERNPPRPRRWRLDAVKTSWVRGKKYAAIFHDEVNDRSKTVHFGATGYEDYTTHRDSRRKDRYLERHGRGREDWKDPTTPGALSRWILWNKPTLEASIEDFKRRFKL